MNEYCHVLTRTGWTSLSSWSRGGQVTTTRDQQKSKQLTERNTPLIMVKKYGWHGNMAAPRLV